MNENQKDINPAELNNTLSQSIIHYNPTRIDYTISDLEITLLENAGSSIWKDIIHRTMEIPPNNKFTNISIVKGSLG